MSEIVLTRRQIRSVDPIAIKEFGMCGLVLMENAGRGCVDTMLRIGVAGPVTICCGKGNNAGDGFVMVRHLDMHRIPVKVLLWCDPEQLIGDAAENFRILAASQIPFISMSQTYNADHLAELLGDSEWIVDALLGTGAIGDPRPPLDQVIAQLNRYPAKKLAVDLPSGLDCDTGEPAANTFRADHTCTFVAAKPAFSVESARPFIGQVHVVDIGLPRRLIESIVS